MNECKKNEGVDNKWNASIPLRKNMGVKKGHNAPLPLKSRPALPFPLLDPNLVLETSAVHLNSK